MSTGRPRTRRSSASTAKTRKAKAVKQLKRHKKAVVKSVTNKLLNEPQPKQTFAELLSKMHDSGMFTPWETEDAVSEAEEAED
jgi:hypothetical protein